MKPVREPLEQMAFSLRDDRNHWLPAAPRQMIWLAYTLNWQSMKCTLFFLALHAFVAFGYALLMLAFGILASWLIIIFIYMRIPRADSFT